MKRDTKPSATTYKKVLDTAMQVFGHDKDKALSWYMNKHPEFDNKSPFELCKNGKSRAIVRLLEKQLIA